MKHNNLLFTCTLFCIGILVSCDKKNDPVVEESPFFVFFDQASITIDTIPVAASTWQYGFTFKPLLDGRITQLGIKLPATGSFTVKLWDLSGGTGTVLSEQSVNSVTAHTPAFVTIPAIDVKKNATLGVTVLANSFYHVKKQDATAFAFPLPVGNISITSFNEVMNANATTPFPPATNTTQVAPCVNVVFIAD